MRVLDVLADATNVIAEGEVLQLMNMHDADLAVEDYLRVIRYKTAKLFEGKIDTVITHGNIISRETKEKILFRGSNKVKSQNIKFIALKSQQNVFLIPAIPTVNSIYKCFVNQTLFNSNFEYEIWKAKLPADIYEIWTIEKNEDSNFIPLFCNKVIKL